jgi:hypothetical protein
LGSNEKQKTSKRNRLFNRRETENEKDRKSLRQSVVRRRLHVACWSFQGVLRRVQEDAAEGRNNEIDYGNASSSELVACCFPTT